MSLATYWDLAAARPVAHPPGEPRRWYRQVLERGHALALLDHQRPGASRTASACWWSRGEKVRLSYFNRSMLPHPMHLHGHFFRIVNPALPPERWLVKDTAVVEPMRRLDVEFVADNPGRWLHHCHNLYHLEGAWPMWSPTARPRPFPKEKEHMNVLTLGLGDLLASQAAQYGPGGGPGGGWGGNMMYGMGWLGGPFMIVFYILLIVAGVALIKWLFASSKKEAGPPGGPGPPDRSLAILRERYAKGEIDQEQFHEATPAPVEAGAGVLISPCRTLPRTVMRAWDGCSLKAGPPGPGRMRA